MLGDRIGTVVVRAAALAGVWLAGSAIAAAQTPPLEVNGVPLGVTAAQLQQAIPLFKCHAATCSFDPVDAAMTQCGPVGSDYAVLECYARVGREYAFGPAHGAKYTAYLKDGRVGEFRVTFPTASADEVVTALTEKYGAPSSDRQFETQNRLGARFVGRTVRWRSTGGEITVERRSVDVDTGLATLIATWYAMATAKDQELAGKSDPKEP
jgi:hypothetical protein